MRVQLRNEPSFRSAETQVLYNRGIKDIDTYFKEFERKVREDKESER